MAELEDLVVRVQGGDRGAYDGIVRQFQDMAVGYAFSLLGDFHLAEDAAQEAFVGAYLDLGKLKDPAAFPGWFRRIVFMRCSRFRRKKRTDSVGLEAVEKVVADDPLPDAFLDGGISETQVFAAIGTLPEQDRTVVMLYYLSDFSQKDIAAFMEWPVTKVNNRLHGARKRLKKEFLKMTHENLQTRRPSRDDVFSRKVAGHLKALEGLHTRLADSMGDLVAEELNQPVQVKVVSAKQATYGAFLQLLGNPSCTLTFGMEPMGGRVTFDIPIRLAWTMLDRARGRESEGEPRPVVWDELKELQPLYRGTLKSLRHTWETLFDVSS